MTYQQRNPAFLVCQRRQEASFFLQDMVSVGSAQGLEIGFDTDPQATYTGTYCGSLHVL